MGVVALEADEQVVHARGIHVDGLRDSAGGEQCGLGPAHAGCPAEALEEPDHRCRRVDLASVDTVTRERREAWCALCHASPSTGRRAGATWELLSVVRKGRFPTTWQTELITTTRGGRAPTADAGPDRRGRRRTHPVIAYPTPKGIATRAPRAAGTGGRPSRDRGRRGGRGASRGVVSSRRRATHVCVTNPRSLPTAPIRGGWASGHRPSRRPAVAAVVGHRAHHRPRRPSSRSPRVRSSAGGSPRSSCG